MTRLVRGPAVALLVLPWCFGQPQRLPVKRVVLYKNGVAYFEHVGQVRGNQEVTIPMPESAAISPQMVPIVNSPIGAEKVSIWNERSGAPRPARALWLTNSSGLTLDGGSFSVMEEQTFAGEGVFDPIRPGEKRLVSYALDLALNASSKNANGA